jgi:hypothetical protein
MIQSSFPKVADQIISYNKTVVEILSKISSLTTTTDSSTFKYMMRMVYLEFHIAIFHIIEVRDTG